MPQKNNMLAPLLNQHVVKSVLRCYLDEAFQLVVLSQELRLLLLQGEDVVRRLLQDGSLAAGTRRKMSLYNSTIIISTAGFLGEVLVPCPHLAQFLSIRVWQQRLQGLEAGIDALHATPLVAVGDLTADSPLLVLSRLGAEWNVGQTEVRDKSGEDARQSSSSSSSSSM